MTTEELLLQDKRCAEKFLRDNNFPPETTADKVIEELKEKPPTRFSQIIKGCNNNLFDTDIKGTGSLSLRWWRRNIEKTHEKSSLDNVVFTYGYYFGKIHADPNDANTILHHGRSINKINDGGTKTGLVFIILKFMSIIMVLIDPKKLQSYHHRNDDGGAGWVLWRQWTLAQVRLSTGWTVLLLLMLTWKNLIIFMAACKITAHWKGSSKTDWKDGESWTRLFGGDGMYVNTDDNTTYVGFQFGNYFKLGEGKPKSIKTS